MPLIFAVPLCLSYRQAMVSRSKNELFKISLIYIRHRWKKVIFYGASPWKSRGDCENTEVTNLVSRAGIRLSVSPLDLQTHRSSFRSTDQTQWNVVPREYHRSVDTDNFMFEINCYKRVRSIWFWVMVDTIQAVKFQAYLPQVADDTPVTVSLSLPHTAHGTTLLACCKWSNQSSLGRALLQAVPFAWRDTQHCHIIHTARLTASVVDTNNKASQRPLLDR